LEDTIKLFAQREKVPHNPPPKNFVKP